MTPSPIRRVLSILRAHDVRFLLMGGQACVFYGAAEFSRDTDIVLLAELANLQRLRRALAALHAECIAVPQLSLKWLRKGHAVHFRCHHPEVENMRLDVMAVLRNAPPFNGLWKRRTTITLTDNESYDLISLPDLVQVKKTQRDKDWFMLGRLVEAHYFNCCNKPSARMIAFWLKEMRAETLLISLTRRYPKQTAAIMRKRPLLIFALRGDEAGLARALKQEEEVERRADRLYWAPLKKYLERLRHYIQQTKKPSRDEK